MLNHSAKGYVFRGQAHNGPTDGNTWAWLINFGYAVSDSFTLPGGELGGHILGFHFVYWTDAAEDPLTSVDMAMGSTPFGTDLFSGTLTNFTNTYLGTNQYGLYVFQADFGLDPLWYGQGYAGYVTLQNAGTTYGSGIYWDQNSGPSTAYENYVGSIPSESFTVTGYTYGYGTTPEPSSIMLFGSGILGLAGVLRRKLNV
jgi:hypothetical protein